MKKEKKKSIKTFNTDELMIKLWHALEEDYRRCTSSERPHPAKTHVRKDIGAFRQYKWPDRLQAPPYIFKWEAQMENLFKRYIFQNDLYTKTELEDRTNTLFAETAIHICKTMWKPRKAWVHSVIREARRLVKSILGSYDATEHAEACRFGTKATTGSPAAASYLDLKVEALSGPKPLQQWFKNHLTGDPLLCSIVDTDKFAFECSVLEQTNVPKSYKILRGITPDTTIGNFYTGGLGRVVENRLRENANLDIRTLQEFHRAWVKLLSVTLTHATGDLSSASQCFTSPLINALCPREWVRVLNLGRCTDIRIGSQQIKNPSFMAMGIGYTFPLQTLLFYSLLSALQKLTDIKGRVSVYGDDLIYPRRLHPYVSALFSELGFKMNADKTYVTSAFRESCGADYYKGIDVRPYRPEGQASELTSTRYLAMLYKLANGLLRRWEPVEIKGTLRLLVKEILRVSDCVYRVPPSYPDYSGIRDDVYNFEYDPEIPWALTAFDGNGSVRFPCLKQGYKDRFIKTQGIYLWDILRDPEKSHRVAEEFLYTREKQSRFLHDLYASKTPRVRFIKAKEQPKNYRSKFTGKRIPLCVPVVPKYRSERFERTQAVEIFTPKRGLIAL